MKNTGMQGEPTIIVKGYNYMHRCSRIHQEHIGKVGQNHRYTADCGALSKAFLHSCDHGQCILC
jgi:hypothetical protein